MQQTTALLFQTHFFDRWAAAAFRRLRAQCPPGFAAFVLIHLPADAPVPRRLSGVPHHVARTPEIRHADYPLKSGGADWSLWSGGHTDLILLHFWRANPGFARYWSVEYDVRFSGNWRRFFDAFEADATDLLTPALVRRRDDPGWYNWPSMRVPPEIGERSMLRGFMPIYRASGRMVRAVDEAYRGGWGGHCEGTWPTIAAARGLSIADLGGDGEFTPARYRGRFYTSTPLDVFLAPGTLVFKPPLYRVGSRPGLLWHPVKPWWWRAEIKDGLRDLRRQAGRLLRAVAPWAYPLPWHEPPESAPGPRAPAQ
jgi:hypothetical protein